MQINMTTDYALRCVLFLATKNEYANSKEVGDAINVSRDFVQRIMQKLRMAGLVENTMGARGGYVLAKPASEIYLTDIFGVMEDTMRINRCVEDDTYCNMGHPESCHMHAFYCELQSWFDYCLGNTTIDDIIKGDLSIFKGMKKNTDRSKVFKTASCPRS